MMMTKCATAAMTLVLVGIIGCAAYGQPDRSNNAPGATQEEFESWMTELSNCTRS